MCLKSVFPDCWKNARLIVFILVASSSSWEFCFAAKMETLQMSSLLADTVNLLIERLRAEKNTINSIDDASGFPETRGGGHGGGYGGGGGGNGHGAITLDPVSIISLLALGAFLINNILQLLRANMGAAAMPTMPREGGRLMRSQSDVLPFIMPSTLTKNGLPFPGDEPSFIDFFENVGSLYYLQPKKRNMCMKRVVCNYINLKEGRENNPAPLKNKIFDFMLSTVTKLVAPEISDNDKEEKCTRAQKFCSDALLKDARVSIEYKIYSQVSSWITKLAFNGLASG